MRSFDLWKNENGQFQKKTVLLRTYVGKDEHPKFLGPPWIFSLFSKSSMDFSVFFGPSLDFNFL